MARGRAGAFEREFLPAQGLAISRSITLLPSPAAPQPPVSSVFTTYVEPPWSIHADEAWDVALDGLLMTGEALPSGRHGLSLYEHSDPTTTMTLRKQGADILFAP